MAIIKRSYLVLICIFVFSTSFASCSDKVPTPEPMPGSDFGTEWVFTESIDLRTGISIIFEGDRAYFSTLGFMHIACCGAVESLRDIDISQNPEVEGNREAIVAGYGYITARDVDPYNIQYHAYYISGIGYDSSGNVDEVRCYSRAFTPGVGWQ